MTDERRRSLKWLDEPSSSDHYDQRTDDNGEICYTVHEIRDAILRKIRAQGGILALSVGQPGVRRSWASGDAL